ncbi:MAG: hypothetical protein EAZ40_01890, partial [Rhodobacterales bacterium]
QQAVQVRTTPRTILDAQLRAWDAVLTKYEADAFFKKVCDSQREWCRRAEFRAALPETAFYIEPDYSNQMCADLLTGILDFAVMFSPKPHPDLHFESAGEVTYRMISTDTPKLAGVRAERFVFAHFSPAFEEMHRQLTPDLAASPVSVGQSGSVVSLLMAMGGSGYVLEKTAMALIAGGRFMAVADAPDLRQPVFAALHIRHRTQGLHRKLTQLVSRHFPG